MKIEEIKSILGMEPEDNVKIVTVTPEMAEKLLCFNTHNRPRQEKRIKEYADDMKLNKWHLSESCLGFDKAGVLTNGQTRLEACISSNSSFETIVCTCLEQNIHMDTGNVRRVIDNIVLNGDADNYINVNVNSLKVVCEILRMLNGYHRITPEPVVEFCKTYGTFIDEAYNSGLLSLQGTESGLFRVQIAAAFLVAIMNGVDKSVLNSIRSVLTNGMTSNANEQIIINWRTSLIKLTSGAGSNSKVNRRQMYYGTQHMIYCVANTKKAKRIKTDVEYYPILF